MTQSDNIKALLKGVAKYLDGEYTESIHGVPHVICEGFYNKFSIVYVAKSGNWKVFFPYPKEKVQQRKQYFKNSEDMYRFLQTQGVKHLQKVNYEKY